MQLETSQRKQVLMLALAGWFAATLLRFQGLDLIAGLTYDDTAYASSGKTLLLEGYGSWGDSYRALPAWFTAFFHSFRGISVENVAWAFATMRSLGELFLILAAMELYPQWSLAPLLAFFFSETSFVGTLYGKQHLSSLLGTVPFAIWIYARYLNRGHFRLWLGAAIAAGLVFLSHYNALPALVLMLFFESLRQMGKYRQVGRVLVHAATAVALCVVTVAIVGKATYGFANWFTYLKRVWFHILSNQARTVPAITDAFLFSLSSWDGIAFLFNGAGLCWWIRLGRNSEQGNRVWALACTTLFSLAAIILRYNLGYASYPRLYVFAFPLLWLASAGLGSMLLEEVLQKRKAWVSRAAVLGLMVFPLGLASAFHTGIRKWPSANRAVERYVLSHPTSKIAIFGGNPFFGEFLFGWNVSGPNEAEQTTRSFWDGFKTRPPQIPPSNWSARNELYLSNTNLSRYCDLVVIEHPSKEMIHRLDELLRRGAPRCFVTNFCDSAVLYPPIWGKSDGEFTTITEISITPPIVRVYDLRGEIPGL